MIDPFIINYLTQLKGHNNREWFNDNKKDYQKAKELFEVFVTKTIDNLKVIDSTIAGVEAKECIFRIFRDVRFSKNKEPYKNHFGAYLAKGGRKSTMAGYYIHIEPGQSMFASGVYAPAKDELKAIRKEVYNFSDELKEILNEKSFKTEFPELYNDKLKIGPKDFPKDFKDMDLLKYKSYIVSHNFSDDEVLDHNFSHKLIKLTQTAWPFNRFLNEGILSEEEEIILD